MRKTKKLTLAKETVRVLADATLAGAKGAVEAAASVCSCPPETFTD